MAKKNAPPTQVSAFEKDTFQDYFERMEYWFLKFESNSTSSNEAEAFAVMANHLIKDWLPHFFPKDYKQIQHDANVEIGRELEMIREIADGLKHITLDRNHKVLDDQKQSNGLIQHADGSLDIERPGLYLILKDKTKYPMEFLSQEVYGFWANYLKTYNYITSTKVI